MSVQSSKDAVVDKTPLSKEEEIELLGEGDDEKKEDVLELDDKDEKEDKEKEDEEKEDEEEDKDELKEIEEDLEEPDEEKLELMTPVRRREILSKYPKLFKDFPYLEKAYYREQKFTEVFQTPQDAQVAAEKAETLDGFEQAIMGGNLTDVLKAAKDEDQNAFYKLVDNYLPNLMEVDRDAYFTVIGNVIKDSIISMVREGNAMGKQGEPLIGAANIINQWVFGTNKFTEPQRLSKQTSNEDNTKEKELEQREQQILQDRFETVKDDLQGRIENTLKNTIDGNIDPRNGMTEYVKKHACSEAYSILENMIDEDRRFRTVLDRLWERAFEKNFSRETTDAIRAAYLSKAKTLLPTAIKKARNDALRGTGKRVKDDVEEKEESTDRKGPISGNKPVSSGKYKTAKDIPREMKTLDVLMQD